LARPAIRSAREALAAKNGLTATDAKFVEDAFQRRLSELPSSIDSNDGSSGIEVAAPQETVATEGIVPGQTKGIDKSVLAVAAPRRYRNWEHLRSVSKQSCLICSGKPSDPRQLGNCSRVRSAARPATNSPCRSAVCIIARSIARDERARWQVVGIDPIKVAHPHR
jgi:hypothetical protein